jgi:signal transduction histidine kinase
MEHAVLYRPKLEGISNEKYWESYAVPIKDKSGDIINVIQVTRNITERKKAEEELRSSREQLRNLSTYLQSAREQERTNIAREIHDELGQALTALKMDLSWLLKKLPKAPKRVLAKIKSMSKIVAMTIRTVQRISAELRPGLLDDLGLIAAIEWESGEFQNRTGIKCTLDLGPDDIILEQDRSTAIFRIFQETLTNVARHADATNVQVSLKKNNGNLVLKVSDNGKGITERQIVDSKSFGLVGMRERAFVFGGKVDINGIMMEGTTVIVTIPFEKERNIQWN